MWNTRPSGYVSVSNTPPVANIPRHNLPPPAG
jgi:hypothetical protein